MKRYYITLAIAAVVVALDQLSKKMVMDSLPLWKSIPVINGFFNLVHVRNRGAAFGFLNRSDIEWQFWLFAAFAVLAVILVLYMVRSLKPVNLWGLSAFGAILGGALGNFIDRVRFRHVVDFLDFYVGGWHWPAFNVADIALCYGITVFAIITLCSTQSEKTKQS